MIMSQGHLFFLIEGLVRISRPRAYLNTIHPDLLQIRPPRIYFPADLLPCCVNCPSQTMTNWHDPSLMLAEFGLSPLSQGN